jgi:hypothetical protein
LTKLDPQEEKVPVVIRNEYIIYLERVEDSVFIHCDVFKWNKTTKKNLHDSLDTIIKLQGREIFALHTIGDTKHKKFLRMYGFKFLDTIRAGINNELQDLFVKKRN